MSDTPSNDTFRVTGATMCGTTFNDVVGAHIDETIGKMQSRPGARLSPASCIDSYDSAGGVRFQKRQTPAVRGTAGSFTINVLEIGGTAGTIVHTGMVAADYHFNGNVKPHEHEQNCFYDAGNTENLAPISTT